MGACPGNSLLRPLALGLQPKMGPRLFKGDLHRPASDDPWQDLRWRGLQVGTEKGLHAQQALGITDQYKAALHGRQARGVPQRGMREDPQLFALATVPVHLHVLPGCIRPLCPALQAALASPLGGFGAALAWRLGPGR